MATAAETKAASRRLNSLVRLVRLKQHREVLGKSGEIVKICEIARHGCEVCASVSGSMACERKEPERSLVIIIKQ